MSFLRREYVLASVVAAKLLTNEDSSDLVFDQSESDV